MSSILRKSDTFWELFSCCCWKYCVYFLQLPFFFACIDGKFLQTCAFVIHLLLRLCILPQRRNRPSSQSWVSPDESASYSVDPRVKCLRRKQCARQPEQARCLFYRNHLLPFPKIEFPLRRFEVERILEKKKASTIVLSKAAELLCCIPQLDC